MTKLQKVSDSGLRTLGITCSVIAVLYFAREILIPLAFAITVSLILSPVVTALGKLRIGRAPAAILVIVAAATSIGAISWVIFNQLVEVAIELPQYRDNIARKIDALNAPGKSALGRAAESVKELEQQITRTSPVVRPPADVRSAATGRKGREDSKAGSTPLSVRILPEPGNELQYVGNLIEPFLRPLAIFGMVLVFSLYLLIEHHDLRDRLFRLAGLPQLNVMTQALDDATQRVGRYLLLQFLVNVCFGALCGIGLYLIGVPYAALWGTVASILRMVPYVGSLAAAALPFALSLAVFEGWKLPLLVLVLFGTLELITGNFVEPWLYGIHTGISSLALLLTTVFWAALWGPAGLILSTPLTVCVVVLGRYVPQFSFLHVLLGDDATLEAEAQIYQRLLAMDDEEARAVADRYLKDHTLTQLYDSVLVPMLSMAERDRHKGALDPTREEFLFLSMKEMLADLPDLSSRSEAPDDMQPKIVHAGRVMCVPANDEADEVSAAMLSQLLELSGCPAISFPAHTDLHQLAQALDIAPDDSICVCAVPPFALPHARTLSHQLRVHFPRTVLVVGVWGFSGEPSVALERFQGPRPDHLVASFEEALKVFRGKSLPYEVSPLNVG
ncbi:MAG TPA: AI-2E family transporter [Bryobacteraceae bacterium]|nr:AI-2E family transporter [Bryobacteraceae bacterium]